MNENKTPLKSALDKILALEKLRFYMPGHKGRMQEPFNQIAPYDITEITGADNLYQCEEAILELEKRIAAAYSCQDSIISASGSTLCIQTMLFLSRQRGRKIIAARNSHRSAVSMMGILGLDQVWIPTNCWDDHLTAISGISKQPTPYDIEQLLKQHSDTVSVYITSPDYFGQMADIPAISEVCKKYDALLLVDNAHGAHLNCFRAVLHPINLGADMCCDSLHKNLPVLTGGAVLHLAHPNMRDQAKYAMSLFGTTSPSYLIMLSIDQSLAYMEDTSGALLPLAEYIGQMKERLYQYGYQCVRQFVTDPIRLAVGYDKLGYTKSQMEKYLSVNGIEPEYISDGVVIFMPSIKTTSTELSRLESVLTHLPHKTPIPTFIPDLTIPKQVYSIREAMSRKSTEIPVEEAAYKVSARLVSKCPPGIPIVAPGEEISPECVEILKLSGIKTIFVTK